MRFTQYLPYATYLTRCHIRANVFARFAGLFYAGIAFGPAFGSFIIRTTGLPTLALFYIGVGVNALNVLYVWLVLPESLSLEARAGFKQIRDAKKSLRIERNNDTNTASTSDVPDTPDQLVKPGLPWRERMRKTFKFVAPLGLLAPRKNDLGDGRRGTSKWDFDLTFLGLALWCSYLCNVSHAFS